MSNKKEGWEINFDNYKFEHYIELKDEPIYLRSDIVKRFITQEIAKAKEEVLNDFKKIADDNEIEILRIIIENYDSKSNTIQSND